MRGPSNYFLYAVKLAKIYLKISEDDVYQIQEMIFKDLYDALEYANMNSKLVYMTNYIKFMIIEETRQPDSIVTSLNGWKVLEEELLNLSINQSKNHQSYIEAINGELHRGIKDFEAFEDLCMIASELDNSRRISLTGNFNFLFCCIYKL